MPRKPIRAAAGSRDTPREFRVAGGIRATIGQPIAAADGEKKLGTFAGTAYTGGPMRPMGWWHDVVIDLTGVQYRESHPALRQHDHEQIVGHTGIKVDSAGIHVIDGVFSGEQQHVDKVVIPARNQFPWQLSVGADPIRTEFLEAGEETEVNGQTVTGPLTISRETKLGEVSFVPLGADSDTSVSVAAQKGTAMNPFQAALKQLMAELRAAGKIKAAKYTDEEVDKMSVEQAKAALKKCMAGSDEEEESEDDEDEESEDEEDTTSSKSGRKTKLTSGAAKLFRAEMTKLIKGERDALAKEREERIADLRRETELRATAARYGISEIEIEENGKLKRVNFVAHALANRWSEDKAELAILHASRPGAGVGVPGGLGYAVTPPAMNEAVLEAAMLHAMRHQLKLMDADLYTETAPDGRTQIRRVPERLEKEVRAEWNMRYTDQVQQAAHTMFKGRVGLHQVLALGLQALGYRDALDLRSEAGINSALKVWDTLDRQRMIRAEGASNLNISNVLANVLNKFALQGYLFTEQSWRDWCAVRPVTDFKATKYINLVSTAIFKKFGPAGELSNIAVGDQAFSNQADPYGAIITIPWTHLVNDDLGMLGQVPLIIGRAAGLALLDCIYALLTSMAAGTVNGDDGVAFWRTGSLLTDAAKKQGKAYKANKISGGTSALSSAALQAAKALLDNQVDPAGFPLGADDVMPILLHGPSTWVTATELASYRELVYGGASGAKQPQGNVWAGKFKPSMTRYMENASYVNSTTAFFVVTNPAILPTVEACFLGGVDTPAVLTAGPDFQFDRPGLSIRGTMPFGATQQNFRGSVYSVGA